MLGELRARFSSQGTEQTFLLDTWKDGSKLATIFFCWRWLLLQIRFLLVRDPLPRIVGFELFATFIKNPNSWNLFPSRSISDDKKVRKKSNWCRCHHPVERKTNKDAFFGFGHLSFQINEFRCFWADGLASPRFVEKQLVDHFNGLIFLPWKKKKFALTTVLFALLN